MSNALKEADATLDEVTINQLTFKIGISTNVMISIVKHLIKDRVCWGDEIPLPVVEGDDRNCIGISFRRLMKLGIIYRTDLHRRSTKKEARARTIWKYRVGNEKLAVTFLERNKVPYFRMSTEELDLKTNTTNNLQ